MGDSGGSSENQNFDRTVDSEGLAHKDSDGNWTRVHSC